MAKTSKKQAKPEPSRDDLVQARAMFLEWERSSLASMDMTDAGNLIRTIAEAIAFGRDQASRP